MAAPGLLHAAGNYFATPDGTAVYLAGDHTWTNNTSYSNYGTFSFSEYVSYLQSIGANLIRYWAPDPFGSTNTTWGTPSIWPFNRTGAGTAHDGGAKFDLTSFNAAYFSKLLSDVQAAASAGIYVSVMLFFDFDPNGGYKNWIDSPFNGNNNVNGTTTSGTIVEQGSDATTLGFQHAYAQKVLDTLGAQPNVLYEIANEASFDSATEAWQTGFVTFIKNYQQSKGYLAQPVGITAFIGSNGSAVDCNAFLLGCNADWISPTGFNGQYQTNPAAGTGSKVVIADTDHIYGLGGDADWVWRQFTRGLNVLYMDDETGTGLPGCFQTGTSASQQAGEALARQGIKGSRAASQMVSMAAMQPAGGIASSGFALAAADGSQFIVYAPGGGTFAVNLTSAAGKTLAASWIATDSAAISSGTAVAGGSGSQSFTAPFSGNAALILTATASDIATGDATAPAPSASGSEDAVPLSAGLATAPSPSASGSATDAVAETGDATAPPASGARIVGVTGNVVAPAPSGNPAAPPFIATTTQLGPWGYPVANPPSLPAVNRASTGTPQFGGITGGIGMDAIGAAPVGGGGGTAGGTSGGVSAPRPAAAGTITESTAGSADITIGAPTGDSGRAQGADPATGTSTAPAAGASGDLTGSGSNIADGVAPAPAPEDSGQVSGLAAEQGAAVAPVAAGQGAAAGDDQAAGEALAPAPDASGQGTPGDIATGDATVPGPSGIGQTADAVAETGDATVPQTSGDGYLAPPGTDAGQGFATAPPAAGDGSATEAAIEQGTATVPAPGVFSEFGHVQPTSVPPPAGTGVETAGEAGAGDASAPAPSGAGSVGDAAVGDATAPAPLAAGAAQITPAIDVITGHATLGPLVGAGVITVEQAAAALAGVAPVIATGAMTGLLTFNVAAGHVGSIRADRRSALV